MANKNVRSGEFASDFENETGTRSHAIGIKFNYEAYETGYDSPYDFELEIQEVWDVFIDRCGYCKTKEECPKGSNITIQYRENNDCYYWQHRRYFSVEKFNEEIIEKLVEMAKEEYDWRDDFAEPDYEDFYS